MARARTTVGHRVRRALLRGLGRLTTPRVSAPPEPPTALDRVLAGDGSPMALARLLAGRDTPAREEAMRGYLAARGIPFARHAFATPEGRGESYAVECGTGDRV